MELIVDLHLHSHYSRATSSDMNLESMYSWGKIKGINVLGTGDFTHPGWFGEISQKLEPAEPGLFKLKDEFALEIDKQLPKSVANKLMRFVLSVEISNIYKRHDRVRRVHNVVVVPSLKAASYINSKLEVVGNLKSDGRPILGLDSEELLKITLESDEASMFIPAHIWTPWFAMFGSKSGFDSVDEAFGRYAKYIKAIETGLSSDPFMNWRLSALDRFTLVSNSDAHSARKLGREANLLNCNLSYREIAAAINTGDERFVGTIEFFPQEGKYHFSGHSKCKVVMSPKESARHNHLCPKCGKKLVLGVDHRVSELADRPLDYKPKKHKQVDYIVPLSEILAEVNGIKSSTSKTVEAEYHKLIAGLGTEFFILRKAEIAKIAAVSNQKTADAISMMRKKDVYIEPGYDGIYGVVQIFRPGEQAQDSKQINLL